MGKFISSLFTPSHTAPVEIEPDVITTETIVTEARVKALRFFKDHIGRELISAAHSRSDITFPSLLFVHLVEETAHVTELRLKAQLDDEGLPMIEVVSSYQDEGEFFEGNVFVSSEAILDFSEEELVSKIRAGEIGEGCMFLAGATISGSAIFGRNVIVGQNCKIFGGVIGDDVVLSHKVWIGPDVELATGTLVGTETSLSGRIRIGYTPTNETGENPSLVMIGDSCALDECTVRRGTIIGKHCLVDNNPSFSGLIPDGATVVGAGDSFSIVPF